jgi:hypothetical protein
MGDRAEYRDWFFVSSPHDEESDSEETEAHYWPTELIEEYMSHPSTCGQYNLPHCNIMLRKHRRLILGKRGIVLGTIVPWAEGALLNMGAREVIFPESCDANLFSFSKKHFNRFLLRILRFTLTYPTFTSIT